MAANENKRILCVGLCCVDIVSVCESFPVEDTDQRFLKSSFSEYGIKTDHCPVYEENDARCPVAVIIVNKQNASRTILAALNNIVELRYEDFEKLPLNEYKWIHFEGRNNAQSIERMIHRVKDFNKSQPEDSHIYMSIELEKVNRTNLIPLARYTDYVFVSKEFAAAQGYHTKEDAVDGFIHQCSANGTVICAWGENGAAAKCASHNHVTSPVFPPENLLDTLGAGDTFNAATILALSRGTNLQEAIIYGCKVAGAKCGMSGYDGLHTLKNMP